MLFFCEEDSVTMNTDKDEFFGCMGRAFLSIQGPLWPLTDTAVEPHRT